MTTLAFGHYWFLCVQKNKGVWEMYLKHILIFHFIFLFKWWWGVGRGWGLKAKGYQWIEREEKRREMKSLSCSEESMPCVKMSFEHIPISKDENETKWNGRSDTKLKAGELQFAMARNCTNFTPKSIHLSTFIHRPTPNYHLIVL